ncbi:MAG: hypothetical protein PHS84_10915 [Paludibacter sp.]|nr:hypothetical protein [Paludibacter sp.]
MKKPNFHATKVLEAHHRNEFLLRVRKLLNEMGLGSAYLKFSPAFLDLLFCFRGQFLNLKAAEECPLTSKELKAIQMSMYDWCKDSRVSIEGTDYQMRIIDFYEIWQPLIHLINATGNKKNLKAYTKYHQPSEVYEIFSHLSDFYQDNFINSVEAAGNKLKELIYFLSFMCSSVERNLYWMNIKKANFEGDERMRRTIILHVVKSQSLNFVFEKGSRPVYRVGFPGTDEGIIWAALAPATWGSRDEDADKKLDVYIQSHALRRLKERIDGLPEPMCILNLNQSINVNPVVLIRNNELLIEYRIDGLKMGYVVATLQKNTIVIRTFLFITFSGTPEGQKLSQLTGLNMFDKKYLAIDRLSTFLQTDIRENPVLADLFTRAGCGDLFQTDKIMIYVNTKNESSFSSGLLIKYMNLLDYKIEPKQTVQVEIPLNIAEPEAVPKIKKTFMIKVLLILIQIILFVPFLIYFVFLLLLKRFIKKEPEK